MDKPKKINYEFFSGGRKKDKPCDLLKFINDFSRRAKQQSNRPKNTMNLFNNLFMKILTVQG